MKKNRLHRQWSEKISDIVEDAFSTYLDLLRDAYDLAEERGDQKKMIEVEKELMQLGERR
jgi:hypothetical protein